MPPLPVPQNESSQRRDCAKQPQPPVRFTQTDEIGGVRRCQQPPQADVNSVPDEAEAGKEPENKHAQAATSTCEQPEQERRGDAEHRPGPADDDWARILRQVGP